MTSAELTHLVPDLQPVGWLSVAMIICGLTVYGFKVIRSLVRVTRRAGEFFDDWNGELARPGFDARPGIPERIARLEAASILTQAQLHTNGGLSLRDQTNRIEQTLNDHIIASGTGPHA